MSFAPDKRSDCLNNSSIGGSFPIISFVIGIIEVLCMILIVVLYRFEHFFSSFCVNTFIGVKTGVNIILPIYFLLVVYAILLGVYLGITNIFGVNISSVGADTVKWIIMRIGIEGLSFFFLHNGISHRAYRNAFLGGLIWSVFSGILPIIIYSQNNQNFNHYVITTIVFLIIIVIFYLITWLIPQRILHRRPALIRFAFFNVILITISLIYYMLLLFDFNPKSCGVIAFTEFVDFFQPFIILYALRQDSLFWQGLYEVPDSNLNVPLLGVWEMGRETIGMVADSINQLERRIVPIIPFGQLRVDTSKFFSGGTARVYKGQFNNNQVRNQMNSRNSFIYYIIGCNKIFV